MGRRKITQLIGYGILIFLAGFFGGFLWIGHFKILIPLGSCSTFVGIFFFIRETDFGKEFRNTEKLDILTYFWDKIVLKFWTACFVLWMIPANILVLAEFLNKE